MRLLIFLALTTLASALELPTTKPTNGTIHRWVSLPATLAPWQQATLHAKVTGYIAKISVDKGDAVKAGQVLATLEVPELEADIAKAKAEVKAAEIEVKRLHEARAKSPDLVLPQAVDDAEAKLAIAKAGLERGETQIQFATLKAPFDGIITSRFADPGSLATANTTKLLEVTDLSTLRLQIPVTELETGLVTVGKPVKAQIDAAGATPRRSQHQPHRLRPRSRHAHHARRSRFEEPRPQTPPRHVCDDQDPPSKNTTTPPSSLSQPS